MRFSDASERVRAAVWSAYARLREPAPAPDRVTAMSAGLESDVDRLIDDYEQLRLDNDELMREIDEIKQHTGR